MLIGYARISTHEQTLNLQQDALQLDRLGRSLPHLISTMTDLEGRRIGFKSLTENIDTTTSGGKLIFHIFGALAEFERNLIRERTQAGLAAARARGKKGGRPRALTERQISIAQSLYDDPKNSIAEICRTLKISKATLYRYIKPREREQKSEALPDFYDQPYSCAKSWRCYHQRTCLTATAAALPGSWH